MRRSMLTAAVAGAFCWAGTAQSAEPAWTGFTPGLDGRVETLRVFNGKLYIGGQFGHAGGLASNCLAAWTSAGFEARGVPGAWAVSALAEYPYQGRQRLMLAGHLNFDGSGLGVMIDDTPTGIFWPGWWIGGMGVYERPSGAELFVSSGAFSLTDSPYITRWTAGQWSGAGHGVVSVATAFATFDDGTGGGPAFYCNQMPSDATAFTSFSRWNGAAWQVLAPGLGVMVHAMAIYDDGGGPGLFLGGDHGVGGPNNPLRGLVRWRAGQAAGVSTDVQGSIRSLCVFDDGQGPALYAAGTLTRVGGLPVAGIARWKDGQWSAVGTGVAGGEVTAMAVFDADGPGPEPAALYAAGEFTSAGGQPAVRLGRWGRAACPADLGMQGGVAGQDGRLDNNDFVAFIDHFFNARSWADVGAQGGVPGPDGLFDNNDFVVFISRFFNGCG